MVLFTKLFQITGINPKNSISIAGYAKKYLNKVSGIEPRFACPVIR